VREAIALNPLENKRMAQLEAEVRAVRKQAQSQRQRIADSDRNCKVVVIDIVQKIVFQDEVGNIVSETDGSLVGKLIEVRFNRG